MSHDRPLALVHFNHRDLGDGDAGWRTPGPGERHPNYGDMLVCAAIVRQLVPTDTVRVMFGSEHVEPVRSAILRGSTYLSRRFDYDQATQTLEALDAPIAAIGLGAQSAGDDVSFLDDIPSAHRFVKVLSERSASISVRGHFTAAVLERLGAQNVRVTGCPSLFHQLEPPQVSPPERLRHDERRLGVSLKTGARKSRFCRNPAATLRKQSRAIEFALHSARSVTLFQQGTPQECAVADPDSPRAARLAAAAAILERFPASSTLRPDDLVDHMVTVRSVHDWLGRAAEHDAMIGLRFHGNMVALAQGLPCFYYVYDSRITEFCRLYRLPFLEVEQRWVNPVTAMLEHDWNATNRAFKRCYDELVAFYDENGVEHTLGSGGRDLP